MKVRAIARNTFSALLRNKLIILFCAGFACVVLLMLTPMLMMKSMAKTLSAGQTEGMVLSMVTGVMTLVSGFGSLLAIWASADSVTSEIKSGTVLAVMARPVRRWEFLLGKFLGVQMLMAIYVIAMLALSYLLVWLGGQQLRSSPLLMIIYPMIRYAVYSALAILLVTVMHPVVAFGCGLIVAVLASMVSPAAGHSVFPEAIRTALYVVLPSTGLLSEERFLSLTQTTLKDTPLTEHLIALGYGLDYALVCFLLAVLLFRKRALARE
jgi:ABC-type transport system involved in multi-copper enzyme maturation permease subunit